MCIASVRLPLLRTNSLHIFNLEILIVALLKTGSVHSCNDKSQKNNKKYGGRMLVIWPFLCFNVSISRGIRASTTSTKAQTLTAENNLQAQAERNREIQPHIFTAARCPKILVAYGMDLIRGKPLVSNQSQSQIKERFMYIVHLKDR